MTDTVDKLPLVEVWDRWRPIRIGSKRAQVQSSSTVSTQGGHLVGRLFSSAGFVPKIRSGGRSHIYPLRHLELRVRCDSLRAQLTNGNY